MKTLKHLFIVMMLSSYAFGAGGHDHDHTSKPAGSGRPGSASQSAGTEEGCTATPSRLADFANGDKYDFSAVVGFITNPACAVVHLPMSQAAMAEGVKFISSGPYKLDNHAQNVRTGPSGSVTAVDRILSKTIPIVLDENPIPSSEMLPLLGQLALLSPTAARSALTALIKQETIDAERRMDGIKADLRPAVAADLAASLMRMGVLEPAVAADVSEMVEEMALTSQADSLGQFMKGLAAAANADANLAPTFNASAGAMNKGVQKSDGVIGKGQAAELLKAVFTAAAATSGASGMLEPGATELNEAMQKLLGDKPLTLTGLRALWLEAVRVLAGTGTQSALADAVALSLTPRLVFLQAGVRDSLLKAAASYPKLGFAVQQRFAESWTKAWNTMAAGQMTVRSFNRLKGQYFETMMPAILDFQSDALDIRFLRAAVRWGLVKDADVEKKFPRLFLAQLDKRDRAVRAAAADESAEPTLTAMTDSFAVLWAMHQVHLPVLGRWVKRNEE